MSQYFKISDVSEDSVCQELRKKTLDDKQFLPFVLEALEDSRARVRRYAAIAAGRESWSEDAQVYKTLEKALLKAWHLTHLDNEKRHIADSLSRIGGQESLDLLESVKTEDTLLKKAISKGMLLFERRLSKEHKTQWQSENIFPSPLPIRLWCRRGLESMLVRQFDSEDSVEIIKLGPAWIDILLHGRLSTLFKNRIFLNFGFPLFVKNPYALKNPKVIAEALFVKNTRQILASFSSPPYRIRLEHTQGGHQRSLQWKTAEEIAALAKKQGFSIINDSRQADWEALISSSESAIFLCPKSLPDPRFAYRLTDVPAASHPTIAAALAFVARIQSEDVVWDPFLGSGTELVESYKQQACKRLIGTDLDEQALLNARTNANAAQISSEIFHIEKADALTYRPKLPVSLVITNPPMGRRVPVKNAQELLAKFVRKLPEVLSQSGRLVWMSPFPEFLDKELSKIGLSKTFGTKVDMGGFSAELQRWEVRRF